MVFSLFSTIITMILQSSLSDQSLESTVLQLLMAILLLLKVLNKMLKLLSVVVFFLEFLAFHTPSLIFKLEVQQLMELVLETTLSEILLAILEDLLKVHTSTLQNLSVAIFQETTLMEITSDGFTHLILLQQITQVSRFTAWITILNFITTAQASLFIVVEL